MGDNMANSIRDEKVTEFFQSVFRSHVNDEGDVTYDKLERILASLGRKVSEEQIRKIKKKFANEDDINTIDWKNPDFIRMVASLDVVDVKAIEDCVLSIAFRVFDMVQQEQEFV